MTPTQIKAKAKAQELWQETSDKFSFKEDRMYCANLICDQVIEALNSVKGMGKISKVKMWKLVKQNLNEM